MGWLSLLQRPRSLCQDRSVASSDTANEITVREVVSKRDLNRFVKFPWKIYRDDPNWVPPLLVDIKEFLDSKTHPFYLHGAATKLLAFRGGQTVGRILVSDDPNYNELHGTNVGCFGMFECIDDATVAAALIERAGDWLRQRGRSEIMGPIDYSTNYLCGLLVDGFDTPPRVMMNHHPPYYGPLIEQCGLAKAKDLYSWWFEDPLDMVAKWRRRAERIAKRGGVTVRSFRLKDFEAEVRRCEEVYNSARTNNWAFVKLTRAEFEYLAKRLARIGVPELVLVAEVEGRPVGFSVTLPDINEACRPLDGRLTTFGLPIGLVRLLCRAPRVKTARMLVLDLVEEYRRRGISELMILRTLDYGKNTIGYTGAELGWTLEDNYLINRTVEAVGAKRYKTYRIYRKPLDP